MRPELIFPTYCPVCQQLTFVLSTQESKFVLVEISPSAWSIHPCFFVKPDIINRDPAIKEIIQGNSANDKTPFQWKKNPPNYKNKNGSTGVITEINQIDSGKTEFTIVTTNNELFTGRVNILKEVFVVGDVITVNDRTRIGKGRYRLKTFEKVSPPENFSDQLVIPAEYYQLVLTSFDQEKLEVFVDRLLEFLEKWGVISLLVIPLPLLTKNNKISYRRQINIVPVSELMKKFEQLSVPNHVTLSIKQIKG